MFEKPLLSFRSTKQVLWFVTFFGLRSQYVLSMAKGSFETSLLNVRIVLLMCFCIRRLSFLKYVQIAFYRKLFIKTILPLTVIIIFYRPRMKELNSQIYLSKSRTLFSWLLMKQDSVYVCWASMLCLFSSKANHVFKVQYMPKQKFVRYFWF